MLLQGTSRPPEHSVNQLNAASTRPYRLAISVGFTVFCAGDRRDLSALMQAADASMYEAKRARRGPALSVHSG
jgi:GGDEF domain-containing protein